MNSSNSFNGPDLCNVTKTVASSILYRAILFMEFSFCITGAVLNGFVVILIKRNSTLHINIRLLLGHLTLTNAWYCTAAIIRILHVLITAIIDPCSLVMETLSCRYLDMINVLPLVGSIYIIAAIGIERLYASYKYRTYELKKNIVPVILLIVTVWVMCLLTQTYGFFTVTPKKLTPICLGILELKKTGAQTLVCVSFSLELFALITIIGNYFINVRQMGGLYINQAQEHSLTARFQLDQNVKMNRLLLATIITHICFWILYSIYVISMLETSQMAPLARVCLMHFGYILIVCYTNCNPIISVWNNVFLQNELKKYSPAIFHYWNKIYTYKMTVNKKVDTIRTGLSLIEHHMEIMENAWKTENMKKVTLSNLPVRKFPV